MCLAPWRWGILAGRHHPCGSGTAVHERSKRKRMGRSMPTVCLCLLLLWGTIACALKRGTASALSERGYRVALQVSDPVIFFGLPDARYPHTAEVVVRVRDAQ